MFERGVESGDYLGCGFEECVRFRTKCELARQMIERVWKAELPISWVVADTVYGSNLDLRTWLEQRQYRYVLAVACDDKARSTMCLQILGDGVDTNDQPFLSTFPYVPLPSQGYDRQH